MRRGAHRRPRAAPGQIHLDFAALSSDQQATVELVASMPPMATVLRIDRRLAGVERSAADWFDRGCELEATSSAEARAAYERALESDHGHVDAHLNLGRLLHEAGDLAGAQRHYLRALELEPGEATAAFNLGVVLEDQDRDEQAIAAYERAMASDPDLVDAYDNAVRLHERRGDKAAALRVLKRLRERTR